MANRFPLVVDATNKNIEELPSGDNLDLSGSSIINSNLVELSSLATAATADSVAQRTSDGSLNVNQLNASSYVGLSASSAFPTTGIFHRSADGRLHIVSGSNGISIDEAAGASTLAVVDSSGNVGIGSSPTSKLDISGGAAITTARIRQTSTSGASEIRFGDNSSVDGALIIKGGSAYSAYGGAHSFNIWNNQNGAVTFATNDTERMRIDASGNVGIGTTSLLSNGGTTAKILGVHTPSTGAWSIAKFTNGTSGTGATNGVIAGLLSNDAYFANYSATGNVIFGAGSGSERMRIDSSGNVLVGKTAASFATTTGVEFRPDGRLYASRSGGEMGQFDRKSSDGNILFFSKDSTVVGVIAVHANGTEISFSGSGANTSGVYCSNGNSVLSTKAGVLQDNTQNLGSASYRWSVVYAGTGSINTSDAREKTPVEEFTANELNAAKQLSKEIGTYKFLSAVAKKGDDARKHIGMTVQRAIEIMEANNLDPFAYGFICYDAWEEKTVDHPAVEAVEGKEAWTETVEHEAEYDEDGEVIKEAWTEVIEHEAVEAVEAKDAYTEVVQEAADRYSFRPDEMLFFIARGLEQRITALEG